VSQTESTLVREVKNVVVQPSVGEDAKGLVCKVALLEGHLRRCARPERWPRRNSAACLSSSRSFPFYGLGVLSCVLPLLVCHR
jgi:hypothetical protein